MVNTRNNTNTTAEDSPLITTTTTTTTNELALPHVADSPLSYSAMIQDATRRKEYKRRAEEAKKEWLLENDKPLSSKDLDFRERLETRKYLKEFADSAQAAYDAIKGTGEPDLLEMDSHELQLFVDFSRQKLALIRSKTTPVIMFHEGEDPHAFITELDSLVVRERLSSPEAILLMGLCFEQDSSADLFFNDQIAGHLQKLSYVTVKHKFLECYKHDDYHRACMSECFYTLMSPHENVSEFTTRYKKAVKAVDWSFIPELYRPAVEIMLKENLHLRLPPSVRAQLDHKKPCDFKTLQDYITVVNRFHGKPTDLHLLGNVGFQTKLIPWCDFHKSK